MKIIISFKERDALPTIIQESYKNKEKNISRF